MSESPRKLLLVLARAPGEALAREALDAAMTAALLGQELTLLFLGDGVGQLVQPDSAALIESLCDLGPVEVVAGRADLEARGLPVADTVRPLHGPECAALFDNHDRVLSF